MSIFLLFLVLSLLIPTHNAQDYYSDIYKLCSQSVTSACGTTIEGKVEYPFWVENIQPLHCGLDEFKLSCDEDNIVVDLGSDSKYRVVAIHPQKNMLALKHYKDPPVDICEPSSVSSTILNTSLYYYGQNTKELLLFYNCRSEIDTSSSIEHIYQLCQSNNKNQVYFYEKTLSQAQGDKFGLCSNATILVNTSVFENFMKNPVKPEQLFQGSFEVQYNSTNQKACVHCVETGGLCWNGTYSKDKNTCLHSDGTLIPLYPGKNKNPGVISGAVGMFFLNSSSLDPKKIGFSPVHIWANIKLSVHVFNFQYAVGAVIGGSILLLLLFIIYYCWTKIKYDKSLFSQNVSSYSKDVEAFISQYGSSIPQRFRYATLKKITNSFTDEIGKGGYGNVYRGRLADGRVVAVKVLHISKGNGEDFVNEVASIGRTSHVNVVTLLGYCYEGKRQALIYEFMSNGSLEKFIYGTRPMLEGQHLGWEKLYSIALEIARGLEYLHRGCNTRIVHFDIKPHNILLDEDFRPKISDFGLAKLYNTKESAVSSLLNARGTVGYIAPEVTSRHFGQVSHKSDVYSYGMMILEMVGGRKNVDAGVDHTSQIYYPRWLYKRIQFDDVLDMGSKISKEENELVRKVLIVGLWCIQVYPTQRPSMGKVIEMLEGQISALEMPPSPYLCSEPSSPSNS